MTDHATERDRKAWAIIAAGPIESEVNATIDREDAFREVLASTAVSPRNARGEHPTDFV